MPWAFQHLLVIVRVSHTWEVGAREFWLPGVPLTHHCFSQERLLVSMHGCCPGAVWLWPTEAAPGWLVT